MRSTYWLQLGLVVGCVVSSKAHGQQCTSVRQVVGAPSYTESFGTGSGRTSHPNVLNHAFQPTGDIQDDFYAVGRSADFSGWWMQTDTTGNSDADGSSNGRYLGVNMRGKNEPSGSWMGEFFRVNNISLNPSAVANHVLSGFRFSAAVAGTCDRADCSDVPNFALRVYDTTSGTLLAEQTSGGIGVANDDVWRTAQLEILNIGSVSNVDIVLYNSQPSGATGNDVGIDNLVLTPIYCPNAPSIELVKSANTSALSTPPLAGQSVQFTLTVTNTGNVDLAQALTLPSDNMTYGTNGTGAVVDAAMTMSRAGSSPDNNNGVLEVGETIVFVGTFPIDQKAIDARGIHNTATTVGDPVMADGTPRIDLANVQDVSDNDLSGDGTDGGTGGTDNDPTVIALTAAPALAITKVADDDTLRAVGDVITYTYTVTNTGNVTINNVSVNETHNGSGPPPNPANETLSTDAAPLGDSTDAASNNAVWSTLRPGDSVTFTGTYTVTQTDVDTLQ